MKLSLKSNVLFFFSFTGKHQNWFKFTEYPLNHQMFFTLFMDGPQIQLAGCSKGGLLE